MFGERGSNCENALNRNKTCPFFSLFFSSNNYLSVLYKHIIQVENKNVGLKVGGHKHTITHPPPIKKVGAHAPLETPPPLSYASIYTVGVLFEGSTDNTMANNDVYADMSALSDRALI